MRHSKYKYRNVSKLMKEFSVLFKGEGEEGHKGKTNTGRGREILTP